MTALKKVLGTFLIFSYLITIGISCGRDSGLIEPPVDTTTDITVRNIADLNELSVDYDLATDKGTYRSGESIKITYILRNNTGSRLLIDFNTVVSLDVRISSGIIEVFNSNEVSVTLAVTPSIEIDTGSSQDFTFLWNQSTSNLSAVQTGIYTIEVSLTDQNDTTPVRTKAITIS